jgi:4-amino-4-deoxy-L-arabinose transferase-like glycosyltransferase
MRARQHIFGLSSFSLVIIFGALAKFALHMCSAPGYSFFFDEFYTIALSRHLAFGYVDLPPLVPALVALSRALLGESLFAVHIVPALAGSATLVFVCLIAKEFGGKAFAVALCALGFIAVPLWLSVDSIFCYDSIDQMVLAGFLYTLVRFLGTGNRRLWIVLGLIAGIACITKMTILFMGPGFLVALLISQYRKDLLTPWLGAVLCLVIVAPYLLWEYANHWPTLEYWNSYGTQRAYLASISQYFTNLEVYMNGFLLPLWAAGLYRVFRPLRGRPSLRGASGGRPRHCGYLFGWVWVCRRGRRAGTSIWAAACGLWIADLLSVGAGIFLGRHDHHCRQNQPYGRLFRQV